MPLMEVLSPQPTTKAKSPSIVPAPKKVKSPESIDFASVIGSTAVNQTQPSKERQPQKFSSEPVMTSRPEMKETGPPVKVENQGPGSGQNNALGDEPAVLSIKDVFGALLQRGKEANSGSGNLIMGMFNDPGKLASLLGQAESPYRQVWLMNSGQTGSVAPESMEALVSGSQELDRNIQEKMTMANLLKELGGHIKNLEEPRPQIPLTQIMVLSKEAYKEAQGEPRIQPADDGMIVMSLGTSDGDEVILQPQMTTPTTPAAPPQSAIWVQVLQALTQIPQQMAPNEIRELKLQLHPAELGKLDLAIKMVNGQLHVVIRASEAATGHFLQNQMQDLKQSLSDAGIDCANLQMTFGEGDRGSRSFEEALNEGQRRLWDDEAETSPIRWELGEVLEELEAIDRKVNVRA